LNPQRIIVWLCIAGAVFLGGGWWTYHNNVVEPRRELRDELRSLEQRIERANRQSLDRMRSAGSFEDFAGRTLGSNSETVVHQLRVRLSELAEGTGLREISVGSRALGGVRNPAAGTSGASELRSREIRDRVDFQVARGTLTGTGELQAVLTMLARIRQQPVLWRIRTVSLTPTRDRQRVNVSVEVETIYFPDVRSAGSPVVAGDLETGTARVVDKLSAARLFAPKPEPVRVVQEPPRQAAPTPPEPPAPQFDAWTVVGIVEGATGLQLWVERRGSGERQQLRPDEAHLGIRFVGVNGGRATVEVDGERYWLSVGDTLANRDRPVRGL